MLEYKCVLESLMPDAKDVDFFVIDKMILGQLSHPVDPPIMIEGKVLRQGSFSVTLNIPEHFPEKDLMLLTIDGTFYRSKSEKPH